MKIPAEGEIQFEAGQISEEVTRALLGETSPCYMSYAFPNPIQLEGQEYSFVVLPVKLTPEHQLEQVGRDVVFCQTEAEANETREFLTAKGKEQMVIFRSGNLGGVGFAAKLRVVNRRFVARRMTLPGGKRVWKAFELERDQATGEITVKRVREARNETEAWQTARQWEAELEAEKKKHFDAVAKAKVLPSPPPRCERLTENDRGDIAKAQMEILRRQWKHCFALFDRRKAGGQFSEDDCRKAYLLDLAEQGENPLSAKKPGGTDKEFWLALAKAGTRAARGDKKLLLQLVDYLIAFNWKLGWCYLSEKELAEKVASITKTAFTPGQIGKRRERLGLVAKHHSGPPGDSSE